MGILKAISRGLSRLGLVCAAFGLLAMTAILGWQVFARFALNESVAWSEQAALVLMVGFTSLAAAVGVREGFHIGMTLVVDALPTSLARISRILSAAVVAAFGAALGVFGGELVAATWSHALPTLSIPRGAAYIPLALSGWLMAFFAVEQIVSEARGQNVEPLWS